MQAPTFESPDSPELPYRSAAMPELVEPFERDELVRSLLRPQRWIDLVLAQRERWMCTVSEGRHVDLLVILTVAASLLYALPFGLVLGFERFWHVAALYLGSVAICLPSLHIFATYLGFGLRPSQTLSMGVLVSAVASIFSLGFAPIVLFLEATMSGATTIRGLVSLLLCLSLFAGIGQLMRGLQLRGRQESGLLMLMLVWQCLLLFITFRMGAFLGLAV